MRYIKFIFYLPVLLCILFLLYMSTFIPKKLHKYWYMKLFNLFFQGILRMFDLKITLHDKKKLNLFTPAIFISNHSFYLDGLLIFILINKVDILVGDIIPQIPIYGRVCKYSQRLVFIKTALALRELKKRLKAQRNVLIFPEGGEFNTINKFQPGAFFLSSISAIPIIPLFIIYPKSWFDINKSTSVFRSLCNIFIAHETNINIFCFDPIYPQHYPDIDSYQQAVHQMYINWQNSLLANNNMPPLTKATTLMTTIECEELRMDKSWFQKWITIIYRILRT